MKEPIFNFLTPTNIVSELEGVTASKEKDNVFTPFLKRYYPNRNKAELIRDIAIVKKRAGLARSIASWVAYLISTYVATKGFVNGFIRGDSAESLLNQTETFEIVSSTTANSTGTTTSTDVISNSQSSGSEALLVMNWTDFIVGLLGILIKSFANRFESEYGKVNKSLEALLAHAESENKTTGRKKYFVFEDYVSIAPKEASYITFKAVMTIIFCCQFRRCCCPTRKLIESDYQISAALQEELMWESLFKSIGSTDGSNLLSSKSLLFGGDLAGLLARPKFDSKALKAHLKGSDINSLWSAPRIIKEFLNKFSDGNMAISFQNEAISETTTYYWLHEFPNKAQTQSNPSGPKGTDKTEFVRFSDTISEVPKSKTILVVKVRLLQDMRNKPAATAWIEAEDHVKVEKPISHNTPSAPSFPPPNLSLTRKMAMAGFQRSGMDIMPIIRGIDTITTYDGDRTACRVIPALANGDCGFISINQALSLQGLMSEGSELTREKFIQAVKTEHDKEESDLREIVNHILLVDGYKTIDKWASAFLENKIWIDEPHLIFIAEFYKINIHVYKISEVESGMQLLYELIPNTEEGYGKIETGPADEEEAYPLISIAHVQMRFNGRRVHYEGIFINPTKEISYKIDELYAQFLQDEGAVRVYDMPGGHESDGAKPVVVGVDSETANNRRSTTPVKKAVAESEAQGGIMVGAKKRFGSKAPVIPISDESAEGAESAL